MNIAIYGGSFSPIHNGHLALARQVIKENMADEVWLMVSPQNPLKSKDELWPIELRLSLCRKAIEKEIGIRVSEFEVKMPQPSYTYKTLKLLTESFPNYIFSLLIGADNWHCFDKWAHHQEIIENHEIIVYPRLGFEINEKVLPQQVKMIHAPFYPFSSTEIRQRIRNGGSIEGMLPQDIIDLIMKNKDIIIP